MRASHRYTPMLRFRKNYYGHRSITETLGPPPIRPRIRPPDNSWHPSKCSCAHYKCNHLPITNPLSKIPALSLFHMLPSSQVSTADCEPQFANASSSGSHPTLHCQRCRSRYCGGMKVNQGRAVHVGADASKQANGSTELRRASKRSCMSVCSGSATSTLVIWVLITSNVTGETWPITTLAPASKERTISR